jgi:hypothetical protein
MAAFCGSCGKPLDGGRFCPFCGADSNAQAPGAPTAAPPAPSQAAAPAAYAATGSTAAPKKSSNTLLIVLLTVVVIFGAMGAALVYAAYWAKHRVERAAKDYGVELPSDGHARRRASVASHRDPCSFLTPAEMAEATGVAITESHREERSCNFASADGTGAGAVLDFEWGDGKILMTATRAGGKLMTMAPGTELQTVVGIGDEAYFQNGMLTVRKGDDGFRIMLPAELLTRNLASRKTPLDTFSEMRDIEKGLAQKVVSRM